MPNEFRPLLAEPVTDFAALKYPLAISPKLDGIRAINLGNGLGSRNLKPIPNQHVQSLLGGPETLWFDGELICGDPTAKDVYNQTYRAVMSKDGEPNVTFYLFDHVRYPNEGFTERLKRLPNPLPRNCVRVEQRVVSTYESLLEWEEKYLQMGYEGLMARSLDGRYKYGRSTEREGILLKVKRFTDSDAEVIGAEELMSNQNEATTDALGHTARSTHKENLVPVGILGALVCREVKTGIEFNMGTGFDIKARAQAWADHTNAPVAYSYKEYDESEDATVDRFVTVAPSGSPLIGRFVKFKHFAVGRVEKPRFPVFLGWRDANDIG